MNITVDETLNPRKTEQNCMIESVDTIAWDMLNTEMAFPKATLLNILNVTPFSVQLRNLILYQNQVWHG